MEELADIYGALLNNIYQNRSSFKESELCVFSRGIGTDYNNKLMVVGRATNGWRHEVSKSDEQALKVLARSLGPHSLDWVKKQWGVPERYNTKASAFWRFVRLLSLGVAPAPHTESWSFDRVVWSNLYKVAPLKGNPSGKLKKIQFADCVRILDKEIECHRPEIIIFLTNLDWAGPFLSALNIENQLVSPQKYVQFVGMKNNAKYVVGQHPQGKPELEHSAEILSSLKRDVISDC